MRRLQLALISPTYRGKIVSINTYFYAPLSLSTLISMNTGIKNYDKSTTSEKQLDCICYTY